MNYECMADHRVCPFFVVQDVGTRRALSEEFKYYRFLRL